MPIVKLLSVLAEGSLKIAKGVGKGVAPSLKKQIQNDIKANTPKWTHQEKITELQEDSGLGVSYVKNLIKNSRSKSDLEELKKYLHNRTKTSNIEQLELNNLRKAVQTKINLVDKEQIINKFGKLLEEKGEALIEYLQDLK